MSGTLASCHRCGADLPGHALGGEYTGGSALFCPHCGAPQVRMPEYLIAEPEPSAVSPDASIRSTGAVPPPPPREIDWRAALLAAGPVAVMAGILTVLAVFSDGASFLRLVWVLGGGAIVLALYHRQNPTIRIDGRVGLRIGFAAGLLTAAAIAIALAAAGMVARFGLHRMTGFDAVMDQSTQAMKAQMAQSMRQQSQPADLSDKLLGLAGSEEIRAGILIVYLALIGLVVLVITGVGGAFAGMLATRRQRAGRLL